MDMSHKRSITITLREFKKNLKALVIESYKKQESVKYAHSANILHICTYMCIICSRVIITGRSSTIQSTEC